MSVKRMTLTVSDETAEMLKELAGSERKMGAYVSDLIQAIYQGNIPEANQIESIRLQLIGLSVELNHVKARLATLEAEAQQ